MQCEQLRRTGARTSKEAVDTAPTLSRGWPMRLRAAPLPRALPSQSLLAY
eukprot:COSAG06_NODE_55519_length_289_cov_0.810526_1_plen_49_part_01